jgi:hypothetical protein
MTFDDAGFESSAGAWALATVPGRDAMTTDSSRIFSVVLSLIVVTSHEGVASVATC